MLTKSLVDIGNTVQEVYPRAPASKITEEVLEYISIRYSDTPNPPIIFPVNIDLDGVLPLLERLGEEVETIRAELKDLLEEEIPPLAQAKKLNKTHKQKARALAYGRIKETFPELIENIWDQLQLSREEYTEAKESLYMRGKLGGTAVYHSPVNFVQVKNPRNSPPKLGAEFPLWKVALNPAAIKPTSEKDATSKSLRQFFENLPSLNEFNDPTLLFDEATDTNVKFLLSPLFEDYLNQELPRFDDLKSGYYYFPLKFNGKWPGEIAALARYYGQTLEPEGVKGLCHTCGRQKILVGPGPTKRVGFFTTNQKGFELAFFDQVKYKKKGSTQFVVCEDCYHMMVAGFNYVASELTFTAMRGDRSHREVEYYLIPCLVGMAPDTGVEQRRLLKRILDDIKNARIEVAERVKMQGRKKPDEIEDAETAREQASITNYDLKNTEALDLLATIKEKDPSILEHVSFRLIFFSHPAGNASAFHDVYGIVDFQPKDLEKLLEALEKLRNSVWDYGRRNSFRLWRLSQTFGKNRFKHYYFALLGGRPVNKRDVLRTAKSAMARSFFNEAQELGNTQYDEAQYFQTRMMTLNQYLFLMNSLELLQ